jgi:PAS domain S-box-containing protein
MVGYTPEELLKLTYWELTPEKWHASEKIVDQQILTRGYSEIHEKEYRKKDGTVFPVELRSFLIKDETGSNIGMWAIVRDITERKRIEEALRESEERYRTAIEYSNDGMAIVRGDLHVFVNQKFVEMFGYDKSEEILGKPLSMFVHPGDLKRVEAFRELASSKYECRVIRKDGKQVDVEVSLTKTVYRGETVSLAYFRDITERKRTEEEREKLIHQLQDALANIKTLRGLLPICASCKKVRDDKGYWNQIESFVRDHSEAEFSHGICPDCMNKLYPDFADNEE